MCTGCFPDDIVVCPACKRDDEGYKQGDSDSPFVDLGDGRLQCRCGTVFSPDIGHKSGDEEPTAGR